MSEYLSVERTAKLPRLPLAGNIDLTYRCDHACLHCWVRLPANAPEKNQELSFDEIRRIADEARAMGCHDWKISGGEPMLRLDFAEIFEYLTRRSVSYGLTTNATLITPAIAQLLKRKGTKNVSLYGATAEVYDRVTRHPGGFEMAMQSMAYLKEAGAGFQVNVILMRANYHQRDEMAALAQRLSPVWSAHTPWLNLTSCGSMRRNAEIAAQRPDPRDVVTFAPPDAQDDERMERLGVSEPLVAGCGKGADVDDRLFAACIASRNDFHVDPYGGMSFCCLVVDPGLCYDLRRGTFREAWEEYIPSLADKVRGGQEYAENCGSCEKRRDCRWCAVYGYLEQGRYSAPVPFLCEVARETAKFKTEWQRHRRRFYQIAGITVQVDSDLPFTERTFDSKFELFAVDGPGEDTINIRHHFELPDPAGRDLGREVYRKLPWAISRKDDKWVYLGISAWPGDSGLTRAAVFSQDYRHGAIYHPNEADFVRGGLGALTFAADQILLAPLLADRQACLLHSSGVILGGNGLLFVGHSEAGKSTIVKMLQNRSEILCDDRIIVRRWPEGFKIHGTWCHGEVPVVSNAAAPLRAIFLLEKSPQNRIAAITDRRQIVKKLLACLIKALATADWWEKTLTVIENLVREVPCYRMEFDKSGTVVPLLEKLVSGRSVVELERNRRSPHFSPRV